MGSVHDANGDASGARPRFQRALAFSRELGDASAEMVAQTNLRMVAGKLGDPVLSWQRYRAGLLLARDRPGNRDELPPSPGPSTAARRWRRRLSRAPRDAGPGRPGEQEKPVNCRTDRGTATADRVSRLVAMGLADERRRDP